MKRAHGLITRCAEFIGINLAHSVRAIPVQLPLPFPYGCPKASANKCMLGYSQRPELLLRSRSQVVAQCASR